MNPTVKTDHYQQIADGKVVKNKSYRGLQILANGGVHEHVAQILKQKLPVGARVLELGAGTGALSLRLADLGFQVCAVDYVADNFKASHERIVFRRADLNRAWENKERDGFDAVVGTEIIEHLENTRHFVRSAKEMLKPGGLLVITTPNINSAKSIATFIATGRFDLFLTRHYSKDGHINPVPWFVLNDALVEGEFIDINIYGFKSTVASIKGFLGWVLQAVCFMNRSPKGKILVAVAKRPGSS